MKRIHNMILRILQAENDERLRREAHDKTLLLAQGGDAHRVLVPSRHYGPPPEEGRSPTPRNFNTWQLAKNQVNCQRHIWFFLTKLRRKPTEGQENGTSLHELAIFHLRGGRLHEYAEEDPTTMGTSLRQDINSFKMHVRKIVDIYGQLGDQAIFKPATARGNKLEAYGVTSHIPRISAHVCLFEDDRAKLHQAIATLAGATMSAKNQELLKHGNLKILRRKIRQR